MTNTYEIRYEDTHMQKAALHSFKPWLKPVVHLMENQWVYIEDEK